MRSLSDFGMGLDDKSQTAVVRSQGHADVLHVSLRRILACQGAVYDDSGSGIA